MAKKIKVLDNVSGVEQIINVSSLASNGTITGSDLMLIEQSNTLKKVSITDLSAEFGGGGGGTGNYHVLKVEFEANADYETTTVLPVGAQTDKLVIRSSGLTTGTAPLQFLINGSTTVLLAEQGVEFDNTAGTFTIAFFADAIDLIIASGEEGTFKSEWSGAGPGTGAGFAYLFYWTPLP